MTREVVNRFWSKVRIARGCWHWTAWRDKDGYGQFSITKTSREQAHRFAYMVARGPVGDNYVLHRCDNPSCVRPSHLFLGTQRDNIADMDAKGRRAVGYKRPAGTGDGHWSRHKPERVARGARHGCAKLEAVDVFVIRERASRGERHAAIAADFPVSKSMVQRIVARKAWAHV